MPLYPISFKTVPAMRAVEPEGEECPRCSTKTRWRAIRCPDGREGCGVIHRAWVCPSCGSAYQTSPAIASGEPRDLVAEAHHQAVQQMIDEEMVETTEIGEDE